MSEMLVGRHVIVGASAAGTAAALALRAEGYEGEIVLLESEDRLPYERPPLSKRDAGGSLHVPIFSEDAYEANDIDLRLDTTVVRLDRVRRCVVLDDGTDLAADSVLLATGASAREMSVPGVQLDGVLTLRTLQDAERLHDRLAGGGPLVVVGGGFIGLELAAVARTAGLDVTVIEATDQPLRGSLGGVLASYICGRHEREGVRFLTNRQVVEIIGDQEVQGVRLADGTVLQAATVLIGVGARPNAGLAMAAGIGSEAGVPVDSRCRTADSWVLAAGDVALPPGPWGGVEHIQHWTRAVDHGTTAGAVMAGADVAHQDVPYFWSEQYGDLLQVYGRPSTADQTVSRPPTGERTSPIVFWLRQGRLVGAGGVNVAKELRPIRAVLGQHPRIDADRLADPTEPLRALVTAKEPQTVSAAGSALRESAGASH